ncbi:MAG: hypothetical protein GVY30_12215 [Chloroflexi bacterium]|jgi:hypothetical protein|nr:hypothetical protein [Chloroflexota bacterium]
MVSKIIWDADAPLSRAKGERRDANAALHDYCLMGDGRSLRKLAAKYKEQKKSTASADAPPTLYKSTLFNWSSRYDWVARAERFDQLEHERELREWRDRRRESRAKNIALLEVMRSKFIKGLKYAEPNTLEWREIISGVKMVTEQLRHEFGEADQVVEVRTGAEAKPSPAMGLSDDELKKAIQNLLIGEDDLLDFDDDDGE